MRAARNYRPALALGVRITCHRSLTVAVLIAWWAEPTLQTANAQSGGSYNLKKFTIDSGGGTVTGGDYRLSGTTGQHEAAPIAGGEYKLTGGFWSPATVAPPIMPTVDPSGINKTRFISFSVPVAGALGSDGTVAVVGETALRIKLTSLHHVDPPYTGAASIPFTAFEGMSVWVGPPSTYLESASSGIPFNASFAQCTPHYQDWSTVGLLHVTGSAIAPSSTYHVEHLAGGCMGVEDSAACSSGGISVSAQTEIKTTRWGDVETPYNPPSTTAQPDVGDISALVKKFGSLAGGPIKARALIFGGDAFGNITINVDLGFGHIAGCVDAFRGGPYPFKMGKCTGIPTPPATGACTTDSECTGGNGTGPCNLYCP